MQLSLPAYTPKLKKENGIILIYDELRRQYLQLTPEEWVRQHIINYLIHYRGYPKMLIAIEREISINGLKRRFDIVCFDHNQNPYLLVECKAPTVKINEKVYDQALNYNHIIKAPYVALSNGIEHHCLAWVDGNVVRKADFPKYRR